MNQRTKDVLKCLLSLEDIDLLEFYGHNPYKYKLIDKTAETKTFATFDDIDLLTFYGYNPYKYKLIDKTAETKTVATFDDRKIIELRW